MGLHRDHAANVQDKRRRPLCLGQADPRTDRQLLAQSDIDALMLWNFKTLG
jgi:hypothetical protein